MNKYLAVVVAVVGYLGAKEVLWFFLPQDMALDSWGGWGLFALLLVGIFLPIWVCIVAAANRLWKLEEVK